MADGCKLTPPNHLNQSPKQPANNRAVNQARAMRVAEIINDYRTLLLHISQQNVEASQEEYWEDGFVVLRESLASAQTLMSANYQACPVTGQGNVETEKAELQRYIHSYLPTSNYVIVSRHLLTASLQSHTGQQRTPIPSTQDLSACRRSPTMGHDPRQRPPQLQSNGPVEERNCHSPSGSGSLHGSACRGRLASCWSARWSLAWWWSILGGNPSLGRGPVMGIWNGYETKIRMEMETEMNACCMGLRLGAFSFFGFLPSTDSWVIGSLGLCMILFNRGAYVRWYVPRWSWVLP